MQETEKGDVICGPLSWSARLETLRSLSGEDRLSSCRLSERTAPTTPGAAHKWIRSCKPCPFTRTFRVRPFSQALSMSHALPGLVPPDFDGRSAGQNTCVAYPRVVSAGEEPFSLLVETAGDQAVDLATAEEVMHRCERSTVGEFATEDRLMAMLNLYTT